MLTQDVCPLCQNPNLCALVQTGDASQCWCMSAKITPEILAQIPAEQIKVSCICQSCAHPQVTVL